MPSRVLSLIALAVALLALAGCSKDSSPAAAPASSSQPATTTSTTTTTIATTTTSDLIVPAATASDAAQKFLSAWRNGDQAAASAIASPAAVYAVFGAGKPGRVEDRGCNTPVQGPVLCVYRTAAGELQVRVESRGDGWFVDQAIVSPA